MNHHDKEERASVRRIHKLIDWLCDEPAVKPIRITTPREFLEYQHELWLYCRACDRHTVADLRQLIDSGRGDRSIMRMRFVCKDCGAKLERQVRPPTHRP